MPLSEPRLVRFWQLGSDHCSLCFNFASELVISASDLCFAVSAKALASVALLKMVLWPSIMTVNRVPSAFLPIMMFGVCLIEARHFSMAIF